MYLLFHRSSTSSDQSIASAPPNFRYSNPPQGNPPLHEDAATRKSLQMTDPQDKKIVNLVTVSLILVKSINVHVAVISSADSIAMLYVHM